MKIESYIYPDDDELAGSVADIMALFRIKPMPPVDFGSWQPEMLPQRCVYIRNFICSHTKTVRTQVFLHGQDNGLRSEEATGDAAEFGETLKVAAKRLVRLNLLFLLRGITGINPGPWGILRGVRPTKIPHKLFDLGVGASEIEKQLIKKYALTPAKARILTGISSRQRPFLASDKQHKKRISIYIGIPFCPSRCLYCSFPAYVLPREKEKVTAFMTALENDIAAAATTVERYGLIVENIYIGGGTPTSLAVEDFSRMLGLVNKFFSGPGLRELTVEAGRPDSLDDEKIAAMRSAGVTRTSVNPQTMQEKTLKLIGRSHSVQDIIVMLEKMRYWGIPIINTDVIIGLPGEGEREISSTMEQISRLSPDNLTIHTLALKKGSLLMVDSKKFALPREDVAADMLAIADGYARKLGMVPYYLYRQKNMAGNLENIGYSLPGSECAYNIQVIEERQTIIGIGPAAATKVVTPVSWRLKSCYNPKDLSTYINNLGTYSTRRNGLLAELFEAEEE